MTSARNQQAQAAVGSTQLGQVVCAGSQSVISFQNIPSNYGDLYIVALHRQTGATSAQPVYIKFNSDSTSGNYVAHRVYSDGVSSAAGGTDPASTSSGTVAFYSSGSASATHPTGGTKIEIPGYANTSIEKSFLCSNAVVFNTSNGVSAGLTAGAWFSSAAISRIDLTIASGSFLDGSVFTLYGTGVGPGNSRGYDTGTAFPTTNLVDGRMFVRSDIGYCLFYYNASAAVWVPTAPARLGQVVCAGSPSNISFTGISQLFSAIEVSFSGRLTGAAALATNYCKINGDATAGDYVFGTYSQAGGGSSSTGATTGTTSGMQIGQMQGTAENAVTIASFKVTIPDYANTARIKKILSHASCSRTSYNQLVDFSFIWNSTAAINQLDFVVSAGTYLNGCVATLIGIP